MPLMSAHCWQTGSGMDLISTIQESLEGLSLCWIEEEEVVVAVQCFRFQSYQAQAVRFYRPGRLSSAPATNRYRPCGNYGCSKAECVARLSLRILQDKWRTCQYKQRWFSSRATKEKRTHKERVTETSMSNNRVSPFSLLMQQKDAKDNYSLLRKVTP